MQDLLSTAFWALAVIVSFVLVGWWIYLVKQELEIGPKPKPKPKPEPWGPKNIAWGDLHETDRMWVREFVFPYLTQYTDKR